MAFANYTKEERNSGIEFYTEFAKTTNGSI